MRAEGAAWRLTQEYCIDKPGPMPIEDIAMDNGVLCMEAPLTGCLARLVRKSNRGIIRTHSGIREVGRKRFAISHELGHWFLHEHESQFFICTAEDMRDYKGSPMEVEANIFASELLMPTFLFRPLAAGMEPRLENIRGLAERFLTSLTATAMKFVDVNKNECMLVLSKNGRVSWSKQKGERSGIRIEKGAALHPDSLASYASVADARIGPEMVPAEAWITQNWYNRGIEVTEETWYMEEYACALSLLVISEVDLDEDDDMVSHYQRRCSKG